MNATRTVGMLLLLLFCMSCGRKEHDKQNKRIVHDHIGREMLFPKDIVYTRFLKDTIDYRMPENVEYKVVVYVDSTGCTECKLKLQEWKDFISYIDTLSGRKVAFMFFYNLSDYKKVGFRLKHENFDYPVCLNRSEELSRLNNIREGDRNHTFLLDKENHILEIGNPMFDLEIRDKYVAYMTDDRELLSFIENKTQVTVARPVIDLGKIDKGMEKEVSFLLKNTGRNPLTLFEMQTSCGCTRATYDQRTALTNEEILVTVKVVKEYAGSFSETISIRCNTDDPIFLEIKGSVQ